MNTRMKVTRVTEGIYEGNEDKESYTFIELEMDNGSDSIRVESKLFGPVPRVGEMYDIKIAKVRQ